MTRTLEVTVVMMEIKLSRGEISLIENKIVKLVFSLIEITYMVDSPLQWNRLKINYS